MYADRFTNLLGKDERSPEVIGFLANYSPLVAEDDPPSRKYLGSPNNGIDLLLQDGHVFDIQIYVKATKSHCAFAGELPFGLGGGMTQADVHALLGPPVRSDKFDSKYRLADAKMRATISYDDASVMKYLSIGFERQSRSATSASNSQT
jgi:hypothetical protein